jgi:hypothetical protein
MPAATLQYRNLAARGIMKDPSPYDLDDSAWSGGSNVRFADTKAQRSPVFRAVVDPLTDPPAFVVGQPASSGYDKVVVAGTTGRIWSYFSGSMNEVTPTGFTPTAVSGQFSSGFLGDVLYINNPTSGLYYQGPTGGNFAKDPQWDSTWSAAVFRVYQDYPIAMNVTKGSTSNPTLVKWGDNTLAGLTTASWSSTDPTKNSGETPLSDLTSPIVDGAVMRGIFVIYSQDQVWSMQPSGDVFVFTFERLFSEGGAIGTNCVVEANGQHYVFGPNDIYVHDGVQKVSLLDKKNRRFVFGNLNHRLASRCFAVHLQPSHEILFGYVSSDADVAFPNPTNGCNKGLLYNYVDNTASFVDLPNVTSMALANLNSVLTYGTAPAGLTFANSGGSFADQQDGYERSGVAVSQSQTGYVTAHRLLGYDNIDEGILTFPYVPELTPPAFLERVGVDMDAEEAGLNTYKLVTRVLPQVNIFRNVPVTVQVGASLTPSGQVTWAPAVSFNPTTQYKVDVQKGGRYLAFRFGVPTPADFEVTGFDAEVDNAGRR